MLEQLANQHRAELERAAERRLDQGVAAGHPVQTTRRAVSRRLGAVLIAAGRRLAGPDAVSTAPLLSR
jgi:hypothetical protein